MDISGAEKRTVKQGQFVHELELSVETMEWEHDTDSSFNSWEQTPRPL